MKKLFLFLLALLAFHQIFAQDISQILAGSTADASKYAQNFIQPFAEGEIYNNSHGWFSTARAHKTLGVDLAINVQTAAVPTSAQNFLFKNSDYNTFTLAGASSSASLPTIAGGSTNQQIVVTNSIDGHPVTSTFDAPNGIGDDFKKNVSFLPVSVPLPVVQLGIGIIKHTDLKIRYFPQTDFNKVQIGVFGVGLQHEFTHYLPFAKKIPFLHLSVFAGYNAINATIRPDSLSGGNVTCNDPSFKYTISSFTAQAIASVKFSILEIYTSVGYIGGNSDIDMKGTYTIHADDNYTTSVTDPISLKFSGGGITNTWGIRLNLAFFKIYGDYTFAKYNGAGLGIALSFR